ncbi:MAG: permease-like cell division protein FtsX [Acidimicrobiia bacterium]
MRATYLVGEAFTGLRRNVLVVFAAIIAVFVSLFLAFGAVVLNEIVRTSTIQWQEGVEILVFLRDDIGVQAQADLQNEVQGWEEVEAVRYVSKAEAYQEFQEMFAAQPALVDEVDPSVLPASFRITLEDPEQYATVSDRLVGVPGVYKVKTAAESIDRLLGLTRILNTFTLGLGGLLGVAAIVLIANTIRMAIYARREEVGIMKLVGASNWFIRIPFLLEGMIEGLVGALLAVGLVWLGHETLLRQLSDTQAIVNFVVPLEFLLRWGVLVLAFGALAGVLGSAIALRRFLKV